MKRYLVFAGEVYYPAGGWEDVQSAHDSLEEAQAAATQLARRYDWVQVVDLETMSEGHPS